jgi:hypothetical protein
MTSVDLHELEDAMDFVSGGGLSEANAWVSRRTGEIFWEMEEGVLDEQPPLPDDVDDPELYAQVPTKQDLGLAKPLVMRFATEQMPDDYESIKRIFRNRGAYSRYKALLDERGMLQQWYDYEAAAIENALRDWAQMEGFTPV